MTAQDLYEELKKAADFFGVGFHSMDQIQVVIGKNSINLRYKDRDIFIRSSDDGS